MKAAQKVSVTETSGATFTSYAPYESTVEELEFLTEEDIQKLAKGETVSVITYNRVGTRTKRTVKPI